jgi:tRNA 2-thiouridine synthesizing protein E
MNAEASPSTGQADRLARIEDRLDQLTTAVEGLVRAEQSRQELIDEMWPIVRLAGMHAVDRLDHAEQAGWLHTAQSAMGVMQRLFEGTSAAELDELADSILAIKHGVKAMTQPEVMAIFEEVGDTLQDADHLEPVGPGKLIRASGEVEVQRGLAVVLELLRHAGRATREVSKRKSERARSGRVSVAAPAAVRRPPVPAMPMAPAGTVQVPRGPSDPELPGPACAAAAPEVRFTPQGFLLDPTEWTEELGAAIAVDLGLGALESAHWTAIRAARSAWQESGAAPNVRRLSVRGNIPVKTLYQLFPKAPGKTVARLAGIPKPAGCV